MCYWRSASQFEVDLVLDNQWGIEIKSAASIQAMHLKGIRALKEEGNTQNFAAVSCDRYERKTKDNITIFPWKLFLENLWNGDII
jgi:predicted AAA+ superfamily ATPase